MVNRDNFSFADLENWLNEQRVTEIECLVPDLTGVARGKILPREKFTEDRGMRLPEAETGGCCHWCSAGTHELCQSEPGALASKGIHR